MPGGNTFAEANVWPTRLGASSGAIFWDPDPPERPPMHRIHHHTIDSTNDDAVAEATQRWLAPYGAASLEPVLVSADRQTAGRGRHGRTWASPIGGAYFTIAYAWPVDATDAAALIPLVAGLAVRNALLTMASIDPGRLRIKWPNDLLLDDAKLAGILCERTSLPPTSGPSPSDGHVVAVVGVGVNLRASPDALGETRMPATTLQAAAGVVLESHEVIERCADAICLRLDALRSHGWDGTDRRDFNDALAWRGQHVRFTTGGSTRTAALLGVDASGRLMLQPAAGAEPVALTSGEIDRVSLVAADCGLDAGVSPGAEER